MFILLCRYNRVFAYPGDDVTLTSHLSPETNVVGMEIRWFRGVECIYLYKNGQVTVGKGYEGRLSLFNEELQRGNVSLLLRDVGQADTGIYSCQVITGENRENRVEKTIHLYMSGTEVRSPDRLTLKIAEQDSLDMEESVHSLEMKRLLQEKDKQLQDKIKELESGAEELRRVTSLLQAREIDLDNLRKVANDGETKKLLQIKDKEFQNKMKELESATEELRRIMSLLQVRETDLDNMRKAVINGEVSLKNMTGQLEACRRELEAVGLKLQEKDNERKVLLEELQAKNRAVQVLTVTLQEKTRELEEEKKLKEEREEGLHTVAENGGDPHMAGVPQGPLAPELAEKCEETLREMYRDPKDQLEDIERWIHQKRKERRTREEEESTEALEKAFLSYVLRIQGQIEEEHATVLTLAKAIAELEEGLEHVATDEERGELEVYLKEALERQREGEGKIDRLAKEIDKQRNAVEEKHQQEQEEIREKYEIVSRIEAETNLLKIILPDVQAYFRNITAELQRAFTKQMQAMGRENVLEVASERELDRVENCIREELQVSHMSPVGEDSFLNEKLEIIEEKVEEEEEEEEEEGRHTVDGLENVSYVKILAQETQADTRLEREINEEIQKGEGPDSESETLELEEHANMVNGVMVLGQEEVHTEIVEEEE